MTIYGKITNPLRRSLALRLVFGMLAVQAALIGCLVFDLVRREGVAHQNSRIQRAEGLAAMLAVSGAPWVVSDDNAALDELVDASSAMTGLRYAMFLDPSGRVLAHTNDGVIGTYLSDARSKTVLQGAPRPGIVAVTADAVDVAAPVKLDGHTIGWVRANIDMSDIAQRQEEQLLWGAAYAVVGISLGLLFLLIIARGITGRLEALSTVSNRFRLGDHQVRVEDNGQDEIAQTACGINEMLDSIVVSERALKDTQRIAKIGALRFNPETSEVTWATATAELFGFDPNAAPPPLEQVLATIPDRERHLVHDLLSGDEQELKAFKFTVTRPDGERRVCWFEARTPQMGTATAQPFFGVCQDITERESAAEQLRQAQKMEAVGQLTGGIAHDFNNLLAIVIGNLDFLEAEVTDDSARECVDEALSAALRGAELTRQLLAFSRRQPLSPQLLDLNELVCGFESLWQRTIGSEIEVRIRVAEGVWPTTADPAQVESALLNLVINARDAMPSGGVLTVETENFRAEGPARPDAGSENLPSGDFVVITVSDTGSGMSADVLARACEPFFTTKPVGTGTGLGLSMIYGFAKQSGGHVRIYSEIDHGTSVRIYLPRDTATYTEEEQVVDAPMIGSTGEVVLLVDDDPGVLRIAARQLSELGYKVVTAENGTDALEELDRNPTIDLLLTDIVMPGGMNGLELSRLAVGKNSTLKVLHTSGFTQGAAEGQRNLHGASPLLTKPYRKADLAARVRDVLDAPRRAVGQS